MMAQVRIDFQGRGEVKTFSWARVQTMSNGVQLALGVARQVRALGCASRVHAEAAEHPQCHDEISVSMAP
jgi:hypothetical protein